MTAFLTPLYIFFYIFVYLYSYIFIYNYHYSLILQSLLMNINRFFILTLILVLLLHLGVGLLMVHDEKSRILEYQEEIINPIEIIQLIPEEISPEAPETLDTEVTPETSEDTEEATEAEATPAEPQKMIEAPREAASRKEETEILQRRGKHSQETQKMLEGLRPPNEDGEYRRVVSTDPYSKLVEDAIAQLQDTPFLDKEWKDAVTEDEDAPTFISQEFLEFLRQANQQEPILKKETPETEEPPAPSEAELAETDEFGADKPVTLIVSMVPSPEIVAMEEAMAKKRAEIEEARRKTNIMNAMRSDVRRLEFNLELATGECFENHIANSKRKHYRLSVLIFEKPLRSGVHISSGNPAFDACVTTMTNKLIKIPAEMERIRKFAPRFGDGYILEANF